MKILRIILGVIGVLIAAYLIAGLLGPKSYNVKRTANINAPIEKVWAKIADFKQWESWSPWKELDPTAINSYEGTMGTVNSRMSWVGDKSKSGTGSMYVTEVVPYSKLGYGLEFKVPFESKSGGALELISKDSSSCTMTWTNYGDIGFAERPIMLFMNMDKMLGKDFERGMFKIDSLLKVGA